ncbi:MAG: ATP-binding protein [Sphaerochaeta sp.]|nr:ATP-binding protein [Sphaerochaeta sp.]
MENIIFNTLISRGFAVDVGVVTVNVKGDDQKIHQSNLEIDFIINKGMKKYYIQSALRMDTPDKKQQEERPLLELDDFFRKIIISKTKMKPWVNEKGVITIGLMDFLLDESALDAL